MDTTASDFVRAGTLDELKSKGRLVVHGRHRPVLLVHEGGHVCLVSCGFIQPGSAIASAPRDRVIVRRRCS